MKIVLARPNYHTHLITPPLGLGYLSSYLKKFGHDVLIIDGLNLSLNNKEIARMSAGAGLAGVQILSDFYLEGADLIKKLKQAGLRVVAGGAHASSLPQQTLKETGADYAVIGEGEETLSELVKALEDGRPIRDIDGLLSAGSDSFKRRAFIQDLDSLPFPDWHQINPRKCKRAPHGAVIKNFPVAPVTTSRGCPYSCKFCASPMLWNKTIRFRSAENVVEEIEYLVKDFGVREIHFEDDNLTLKREHIERICGLILHRKLKISWATPNGVRADTLTPDLVRLMRTSGCYFIVFGIESGNQEILNNINKKTDLAAIERAVRISHAEGLITQGFFIFGLPGETEKTISETIDFAKRIPLDRAQFLMLDVMPGTQLWDELNGATSVDWSRRSYQQVTWVPPTVSRDVLEKAPARAFRSFFLRPRQCFQFLRFIKPYQIPFLFQRLKDFRILPAK